MGKYRLVKKDFDLFKKHFNYWIEKYNLNNWEFHFYFEESDENYRAMVNRDHMSRICLVFLNKVWDYTKPDKKSICQCAYHEACELLLSKLNDLIHSRNVSESLIDEEIHVVIRTLENTHWKDFIKNKKI